jgi:hypothetical protein
MRSKHAYWFFALLVLACALPSVAMASSARVQSLGLQGDYVLDYANVPYYPSAIVRYQNLVYGDLGVKDASDGNDDLSDFNDNAFNPALVDRGRGMGLLLGNLFGGKIGTFGFYMNENATPLSPALGAEYINRNSNEAWNVVWGYKFSNMALGLQINRSYSSYEDDESKFAPYTAGSGLSGITDLNARQVFNYLASNVGAFDWNTMGAAAGFSFDWDNDGRSSFADVGLAVRQYSMEQTDKTGPSTFEDDGGLSFAFNGRAHIETAENFHLVPVVNYYTIDLSTKETALPSLTNKMNGLNLGLAGQWKLRESDWLTAGVSFQSVTGDFDDPAGGPKAEFDYTTMPNFFAALESNLWSWFTLRLGASKPWYSKLTLKGALADVVSGVGETEIKDSPFQYSVGAGFHLGRVDLDAVLNQDFAFTGSYLGSGNSEIPFTRLSATYRW